MLQYNKSILPKLLAKENITVQHGNYPTAWFDIKDRVLGLPMWKDMGKDVYDLLIGHEVGHALETPFEGWHDSPEKLEGCPRSYINVVEDARIEKKVQARYPGLVAAFNRGYRVLFEDDFFGDLSDPDWNEIKLIDKINLKTKLGSLISVPFNSEEQDLYTRTMNTETFEDVLNVVRDILAYTKEHTPELIQQPQPSNGQSEESGTDEDNFNMGHDDYESEEKNQEQEDEPTPSAEENAKSEEAQQSDSEETTQSGAGEIEEDVSLTDRIYRAMERTLVDRDEKGEAVKVIGDLSKPALDYMIIDHKDLMADRTSILKRNMQEYEYLKPARALDGDERYKEYLRKIKGSVSIAIKEFEMKKAAYRYQKATTARTGKLDVNKLWSYKTHDDIFLQTTRLADAKDHGMLMLIDFSGSMQRSLPHVLDQLMHTIMFCKGVNIPFEVYAFTGSWRDNSDLALPAYHVEVGNVQMPLLISSALNKADFKEAMKWLIARMDSLSTDYYNHELFFQEGKAEQLGSTPLIQALMASHYLVKNFKIKHQAQKVNFVVFSDGDGDHLRVTYPDARGDGYHSYSSQTTMIIDGKRLDFKSRDYGGRKELQTALTENIRKRYGTNNICFFMGDNHHFNQRVSDINYEINRETYWDSSFQKDCRTEFRKNKCVEFNNVYGFDTYYVLKDGKHLATDADEFEVSDDATDGQIRNAFKKFSKSKKLNKVIMTKFGAAVA